MSVAQVSDNNSQVQPSIAHTDSPGNEKYQLITEGKPELSVARRVCKQIVKLVVRILIFSVAVGGGALLGSLIPVPVVGTAIGAGIGFGFGMLVHNKAMKIIDNWFEPFPSK